MLAVVIGFVDTSNLLRRRSMPEFFEKVKKRLKKKLQTACGMCRDAAARMKKGSSRKSVERGLDF